MRYLNGLLCLLVLFSGVAWGQDTEDDITKERQRRLTIISALEDEGEKFEKEKKWKQAIETYKKILNELDKEDAAELYADREEFDEKNRDTQFKLGVSFLEASMTADGKARQEMLERAQERLRKVLLRNAEQGEAHFYLARLSSLRYRDAQAEGNQKKQKEFQKKVKEHLTEAARKGYNVFVGINSDELLAFLKTDATFITKVLQSARRYKYNEVHQLRNPFRPRISLSRGDTKSSSLNTQENLATTIEAPGQAEQKRLVDEIDTTFKTLQSLVARAGSELNPSKRVIELWQRLQRLLKQRDEIISPPLVKRLNEILKDYAESRSRLEKVQLAFYFNKGKRLLRDMERSFALRQYRSVVEQWNRLREVAQDMIKAGGENFRKSAEALLNNGRDFYSQATTYIDLQKIKHKVTGIIREDYPKTVKIAIVNNRPYTVGEYILNDKGRPVKLMVKDIQKGKVIFKYKGVEVTTYLRD